MEKPIEDKILLLIRGLPGAGKSTLAKQLVQKAKAQTFSIDSYFTTPSGEYRFDFSKNHLAYKACQEKTKEAMLAGESFVIVDHTFTLDWEMEPYFGFAKELGYQTFVVTVENRHNGKNIHGITEEMLEKMKEKFKIQF